MYILYNRLITALNEKKPDSTEFYIAKMMIWNLWELPRMSISDVAKMCAVSKSTISKFVRDIGFEDYLDFKLEAVRQGEKEIYNSNGKCNITDYIRGHGIWEYEKILSEDIRSVLFGIEEDQLKRLAVDLHEYKHLAAFGISYSESAAINLQHKMHYYHKFLYTTMNDRQQENYIESADEETLIFIFSNSGKYITEYQNREGRPPKYSFDKTKAKIVLVTSNEQMLVDKRVDECVLFRYADCVQNHPILYQVFIERLLYSYEELYGASEGMNTK